MGIPDHITCLLRNLYAGQEATVRTGHGTTDWFQTEKEYVKAVYCQVSLVALLVNTLSAMEETQVRSLCWEDPWSRKWKPTLVFFPGEFPWTGDPGGLQSMGLQRVEHDRATKHGTALCM